MRILIVEDEEKLALALKESLEFERYAVEIAHTGEEAFFLVNERQFDLIVLDLMLPGRDGIYVLSTLRRLKLQTPVIILTAKDTVEDRVLGLDSGGDDYLVKPFAVPELLARIRALLRRGRGENATTLRLAGLEVDLLTRSVARDDRPIELTTKEFEIIEYLLRREGTIVTREMLARDIWKVSARAVPLDNVIDVHMARLRKKIDQGFAFPIVQTIRGVGFIAREPD
ncbi:DNA-binding response regulator [Trinickia dabaoshanensis]|uniref:DNA-binding response regulator n=1 Tax=Trinickia dabaoshanensis TaxID=564714 RepID=A0A2N7VN01_9BURK|nr:response regulator transcription factor [Trinickia dabaoshanensis]PMS18548.1 DNA-binding response regulator [Trinickia dabaoshanensis]